MAWYDPGYGVTLNVSNVEFLLDRTGNRTHHLTGAVDTYGGPYANSYPQYIASDANYNGMPTLQFVYSGDYDMMITPGWNDKRDDMTYYLVGNLVSTNSPYSNMISSWGYRYNIGATNAGNLFSNPITTEVNIMSASIICVCLKTGHNVSYVTVNRPTQVDWEGTFLPGGAFDNLILGHLNGFPEYPANMKIAQLLIYTGSHNAAQRTTIMQGLSTTFGIPIVIPADYVPPYSNELFAQYDPMYGITPDAFNNSGPKYWADKISTDTMHTLTQSTAADQPYFSASSPSYGGLPVVYFARETSTEHMTTPSFLTSRKPTFPLTYYFVGEIKHTIANVLDYVIDNIHAGAEYRAIGTYAGSGDGIFLQYTGSAGDNYAQTTKKCLTPSIVCACFNGTGSSDGSYVCSNSTTEEFAFLPAFVPGKTLDGLMIGDVGTGGAASKCKFAQILIYSGAHDVTKRTAVMQSLSARFGITVT
jgi:hypothetical protein